MMIIQYSFKQKLSINIPNLYFSFLQLSLNSIVDDANDLVLLRKD